MGCNPSKGGERFVAVSKREKFKSSGNHDVRKNVSLCLKGRGVLLEHTTPNGRGLLCYIVWRASHGLDTAYNATAPPPVSFTDSMNSEYRSSCYHNFSGAFSADSITLKLKVYVIFAKKYGTAVTYKGTTR